MDAVHRGLIVRFPDAAERARAAPPGFVLERAELLLDFEGREVVPSGYLHRHAMSRAEWEHNPPRWHVVAWGLRRPWQRGDSPPSADDRLPGRFGPAELSEAAPTARLDVTALFPEATGHGIELRKWELWDQRYRSPTNAFEYSVATGGHALLVKNPRLSLTFRHGQPASARTGSVVIPNVAGPRYGAPVLGREEFEQLAARMPKVPSARIDELLRIGGGPAARWHAAVETRDHAEYGRLVNAILATPPRYWKGWEVHDDFLVWHLYRSLLTPFVRDHVRAYWASWLVPDLETAQLLHPQGRQAVDDWRETGDWRGRASFFRGAFTRGVSTQNFNHTASMGALLGGSLIGSANAVADGRAGLENLVLRLWSFTDGGTQEMLDHYYYSISLSAQKMMADFGPTAWDRLLARVALDRSIEMLSSAWHPHLGRMVSSSGRTNIQQILAEQDGAYSILHAVSNRGVLKHLDLPFDATVQGMRVWGYNTPPGRVGLQALASPWGPRGASNAIDAKHLPYEETSTETIRRAFDPPLWRRIYLGRHYGIASQDLRGLSFDVVGQWNPRAEPSTRIEDLGTLTLRYAVNEPDMAATSGGVMPLTGTVATFQHRNRAIVVAKPVADPQRIAPYAKNGVKSLAAVIALWHFRDERALEIFVDGEAVTALPARAKAGQAITVRDGAAFLGIIPLMAADLGRDAEVLIERGRPSRSESNGAMLAPRLTISAFNLRRPEGLPAAALDWKAIDAAAFAGFVVEMSDRTEHESFAAFQRKVASTRLSQRWSAENRLLEIGYAGMELGYSTAFDQPGIHYPVKPGQQASVFRYRRVDGAWPYLPTGLQRDTPLAQQGTSGRLAKNGARLETDAGRAAYLVTDPVGRVYTAYVPLPEPSSFAFALPGGMKIDALDPVGLLRVTVDLQANRIEVDHARRPGTGASRPVRLRVSGAAAAPQVDIRAEGIAVETR